MRVETLDIKFSVAAIGPPVYAYQFRVVKAGQNIWVELVSSYVTTKTISSILYFLWLVAYFLLNFCFAQLVLLKRFTNQGGNEMLVRYMGLSSDAELEEIKSAYRRLSKLYHPDTTQLPLEIAAQKFMRLKVSVHLLHTPLHTQTLLNTLMPEMLQVNDSTMLESRAGCVWYP